ncbi:MAG TPA: HD domain-containing protein [Motilibacterales bacterium]|nr:HD domain-containing protein [Motilibacterales bacterium]
MDVDQLRPATTSAVPTRAEAEAIARNLLGDEGTRLAHVHTAGSMADGLGLLFDAEQAALLVAAATLHDIGYSPRIARTGFHPLDGALHLRAIGLSERLCSLVAHHSEAGMLAVQQGVLDLDLQFPRERSLLADALVYADMHSAPDGLVIRAEHRLADIARRRPDPVEAVRGQRLRAAMARVGAALAAHDEQIGDTGQVDIRGSRPLPVDTWWRAEDR